MNTVHYQIYIEKRSDKNIDIYRILVTDVYDNIIIISGISSDDLHGHIYHGNVKQTFKNKRALIKSDAGTLFYTSSTYHSTHLNAGDPVILQATGVSSADADTKHYKGHFKVGIPFGPIILTPGDKGIHMSRRLKNHEKFDNNSQPMLSKLTQSCGAKLRLSSLKYTESDLCDLFTFVYTAFSNNSCNHPHFKLMSMLINYLHLPTNVFTNDPSFKIYLTSALLKTNLALNSINTLAPDHISLIDEKWTQAIQAFFPLPSGASIHIQETFACTTIDINAGPNCSFESTNLEAIKHIPYFLHTGKYGGKVIIDLLPTTTQKTKTSLLELFKSEFQKLNLSVQLFGISQMGMLELIIPRQGWPLWQIDKKMQPFSK